MSEPATGDEAAIFGRPASGWRHRLYAIIFASDTRTGRLFDTDIGRLIASLMMLMGWGVLEVPTGIVTAEMTSRRLQTSASRRCAACGAMDHTTDAVFCGLCGTRLTD